MSLPDVLQAYGLTSEFPDKWVDSKDSSALNMLGSGTDDNGALVDQLLSSMSQNTEIVEDEQDPLGSGLAILDILHNQKKQKLSARDILAYMPSSTSFDAKRFLRDMYSGATVEDLQRGLGILKESIAGKDQGLRHTVDTDCEKYVSSKRKLDDVMDQLRSIGMDPDTGFGFRTLQKQLEAMAGQLESAERPLAEINARRSMLESALEGLEENRALLELPEVLEKHLAAQDHEQFVREYKHRRRLLALLADSSFEEQRTLERFIAERVKKILDRYRAQVREQLMRTGPDGAYAPLIAKLTDLGMNVTTEWLERVFKGFNSDLNQAFASIRVSKSAAACVEPELGAYLELFPQQDGIADLIDDLAARELDNDAIVAQWETWMTAFDQIRRTLAKAATFCREFLSLGANGSSRWGLSKEEENDISVQCHQLVLLAAESLDTLTITRTQHADAASQADENRNENRNTNTSENEETGGNGGNGELNKNTSESEELGLFAPSGANTLSTAYYLTRVLEALTGALAPAQSLVRESHSALDPAVSRKKSMFIDQLCMAWARDAPQVCGLQRIDSALDFPALLSTYHRIVIEKLRFLADSSRGGATPPAVIATIGDAFGLALVRSISGFEASVAANDGDGIGSQLEPISLSQDARILKALNTAERLRSTALPQIYDRFGSSFRQPQLTEMARAQVEPEIQRIRSQLFEVYTRKKRSRMAKTVHQELSRLIEQWREESVNEDKVKIKGVSNYIYECLMLLVETHALFTESCPQLTRNAVLELFQNLLNIILQMLREIDVLSTKGTLQCIADLEFMRWAMNQYRETDNQCHMIFDAIKRASSNAEIWKEADGPRVLIMPILSSAVKRSQFSFLSLRS